MLEVEEQHERAIEIIQYTLNEAQKKHGKNHVYTANILLSAGIIKHNIENIKTAIEIYENYEDVVPDIFYAEVCLSRIYYYTKHKEDAIETIINCANRYFKKTRETKLITYLIEETLEKFIGTTYDGIESLYRYKDYRFYLTHNNSSNIILIPLI